jgi:hypothetical protein
MGRILDALSSFRDRFKSQRSKNLTEAAQYLEGQWKQTCSVPGTKESPARPGSAPHMVQGGMMRALKVVPNTSTMTLEMHYGSSVASYQDHGTSKMAARPHRTITLDKSRPQLFTILGKKK